MSSYAPMWTPVDIRNLCIAPFDELLRGITTNTNPNHNSYCGRILKTIRTQKKGPWTSKPPYQSPSLPLLRFSLWMPSCVVSDATSVRFKALKFDLQISLCAVPSDSQDLNKNALHFKDCISLLQFACCIRRNQSYHSHHRSPYWAAEAMLMWLKTRYFRNGK